MSWYSWQLQLSKSCRPLQLARTYAVRPDSPFLAPPYRPCDENVEHSPDQPLTATFGISTRSSVGFRPALRQTRDRSRRVEACGFPKSHRDPQSGQAGMTSGLFLGNFAMV